MVMKKKKTLKDFNFEEFEKEAIERLKSGEELTGKDGIVTPLIKRILERALDAELDQHFNDADPLSTNRRNGHTKKQMKSSHGRFELETQGTDPVHLNRNW